MSTVKVGNETLEQYVEDHSTELTQENVFNALTQNGTKQGIIMDSNGNLYINASYIQGTSITGVDIFSKWESSMYSDTCRASLTDGAARFSTQQGEGGYVVGKNAALQVGDPVVACLWAYSGNYLFLEAGNSVVSQTARATTIGDSGKSLYISGNGRFGISSSSRRFKHDICPIGSELDPHKILDIEVVQFKFNAENSEPSSERYLKNVPGFIAEDVDKHYPIAADHSTDTKGNIQVDDWNERYIIPPMLGLIQEQHKEIQDLKAEVSELKLQMQEILTKIGE
jgi:hypothetical protein